jgi:TPR repeat protein
MKDPGAVAAYALMLIDGNVIARQRDRGLAMLRDLANDGFASADLQLGQVLESGRGEAAPDFAGAAQRYKHGCDGTASERIKSAGRYDACRRYAQMLKEGRGVPRDPDEAEKVLKQVEAQKLLDAGFEAFQQRR